MPEFTQEIDIDASEYIRECSSWEISELISELEDRGYIKRSSRLNCDEVVTPNDASDFNDILYKIMNNKHQLTIEDELIIRNIHSKLV